MKGNIDSLKVLPDLLGLIEGFEEGQGFLNLRDGEEVSYSLKEFVERVYVLAERFVKLGFRKGDRLAIISKSSPEWLMVDFACQLIGVVTVSIFANISEKNLEYEIKHSKVKYCYIGGEEEWQVLAKFRKYFKHIIVNQIKANKVLNLGELISGELANKEEILKLKEKIKPKDDATILYTSGSTGVPKGVRITHENFISQIKDIDKLLPLKQDVALSFLPLAHIFERVVSCHYLAQNTAIYFVQDPKEVPEMLAKISPTIMTVVPRVLEKIYGKILIKIGNMKGPKKLIAKFAVWHAIKLPFFMKKFSPLNILFSLLVYRKFRAIFGGKMRMMISGSAALSPDLYKFYLNIGLNIYQGYGLTETTAPISVNTPKNNRIYSSGKIFASNQVKITKEGEIWVKGKNIMPGYLDNEKENDLVFEKNWLKTGDKGFMDKAGYLYVEGRMKDLQKTSTGKFVPVTAIENALKKIDFVDQVLIIADNRKFVSALIFPDLELMKSKKLSEKKLNKILLEKITKINQKFNKWEQIQEFFISLTPPTIENDQLTPSMKLRKKEILKVYEEQIEKIYQIS